MEPRAETSLQQAALKAWAAYCEVSQNEEELREALHDRTVRCEDLWEAMATVEEMGFGALRAALDAAGIPDTIAVDAAWARPLDHGAEARLVVTHTGRTLYSRTLPTRYETEVSFKETLADIAADILAALRRPALAVTTPGGTIIAERSTDSEFPGIWVRIERPSQAGQPNAAAVCVEYQNGEYAGSLRFAVRTYTEGVDEYLHNTDWGTCCGAFCKRRTRPRKGATFADWRSSLVVDGCYHRQPIITPVTVMLLPVPRLYVSCWLA